MRHPALLFDLDGTLIDSTAAIRAGLRASLAAVGKADPGDAELSACIGLPLLHVWLRLGIPHDQHDAAVEGYRRWADATGGQRLARPFPGIDALLRRLDAAGCLMVLATAKDPQAAGRALERHGWAGLFAGHAGAEPGDGPDKRGVVARALAQLPPALRSQAAMVGDMPQDGDGAAAAGIAFVACGWGCGVPAAVAAQRPVFTAASVAELADWLLSARRP
ncbi:MAG: HAD hydrolase-like protein [Planctomycetes bacterium]|nr:HAD hydrolase-like protein [Planctomycetota bacterium]